MDAIFGLFTGKANTLSSSKSALDNAKKLLDAAQSSLNKSPDNTFLKAKFDAAKAAYDTAQKAYDTIKGLGGSSSSMSGVGDAFRSVSDINKDIKSVFSGTTSRGAAPPAATSSYFTPSVIIGIIFLLGAIISLILWATGVFNKKPDTNTTTAKLNSAVAAIPSDSPIASDDNIEEGFQVTPPQSMTPAETLFVNLQPLSIKDAGFKGPYPNGTYDVSEMTVNALKAGFRCLTLNIDYMDTNKKGFEAPNQPTLIVRDTNGSLLSANSGSIQDVCKVIADMGFNSVVPNNQYPIILYLHINRAPSAISKPEQYLAFLSAIARQLNPIAPLHLGLSSLGNFTRQKQEQVLLRAPINTLQGNVVVLCNADTSMFTSASNATPYPPSEDLDFWVNMRVYLDSDSDTFGITKLPSNGIAPAAVIVDLKRILSLNTAKKEQFAANGMNRYVIGMGDRLTNPSPAEVDTALNTLGINCIPIDIFSDTNIMALTKEYSNMTYHPKPSVLRKAD
jgi:hypothetical protein